MSAEKLPELPETVAELIEMARVEASRERAILEEMENLKKQSEEVSRKYHELKEQLDGGAMRIPKWQAALLNRIEEGGEE